MNKQKFIYVSYIRTTPEDLWKALTNSEFSRQYWMGSSIESDWKAESPIKFIDSKGVVVNRGKLLLVDKPNVLSYTWSPQTDEELSAEAPSRVTFHIEPKEQLVKLTVTHDQFVENSKVFPKISGGWPMVLSSLKSLLETNKPLSSINIKPLNC